MSEVEKEKKLGLSKDLGRARTRKMKREGKSAVSSTPASASGQKSARRRTTLVDSASLREHLVNTKVKIPNLDFVDVPARIGAKLTSTSKKPIKKERTVADKAGNPATAYSKPRREARAPESLYKSTAHAETQRKTASDDGHLPRKNRRIYESRSESAPPVMVRGGVGGMAFGRTASAKANKKAPKRRIDVPLHVTGAEVRLPSVPLLHIGWRAVSFLMVLMMTACLVLIWKAPVFQVHGVQAEGLERLTMSDLNAVARAAGKSVFTIDPKAVDEALHQAFPELSKISVKVNLPATVKVVVTERVPVIDWTQDGNEMWVDADGYSFPVRGAISTTLVKVEGHGTPPTIAIDENSDTEQADLAIQVPISTTVVPTYRFSPDLVSAVLALGTKMPPDTLLVYDSEHGLGWNDPQGWEVFFGAEDQDMEMKLAVYQSLVERLQSQGIQPALISVEYVHAPYYRMER